MRLSLAVAAIFLASALAAHAQSASDIVAGTDKVRNPGVPFRSTDTIVEYVAGKERDRDVVMVFSKLAPSTGQFRNLVRYVEPPRDAGKMALLDAKNLWFYDPASKASVRISPQQRLIGQASIGDILTTNLAIDYTPKLIGDDTIEDAARTQRQCWHLDLAAANDIATYNRVELWVEHNSYFPIKAKFYSDSGRVLKILYYRNFTERLGGQRPGQAIIIDAVDTSLVTTIDFGDYQKQDIPETWFERDFLPRLETQ